MGSTINVMGGQPQGYVCDASAAYENAHVLRNAAGTLLFLSGYNSGPDQFIQVHDKLAALANNDVPKLVFFVPTLSNFSFVIPVGGYACKLGIQISNSTTGPVLTQGVANVFFTWAHCN
jgi:hypothetical protein